MANGKAHQLWKTRHRTVVAEDLANDAHGTATSQLHQIDSGFGMAGALKNPSEPGAQWKDMARLHKVLRKGRGIGHDFDCSSAIRGADASGDTFGRIDADLEICLKGLAVLQNHLFDAE